MRAIFPCALQDAICVKPFGFLQFFAGDIFFLGDFLTGFFLGDFLTGFFLGDFLTGFFLGDFLTGFFLGDNLTIYPPCIQSSISFLL